MHHAVFLCAVVRMIPNSLISSPPIPMFHRSEIAIEQILNLTVQAKDRGDTENWL